MSKPSQTIQEQPTATSSCQLDITVNRKWLLEQSDRLLKYEYHMRIKLRNTSEMFPDELSDKIGRSQEYVCGIIKNAISHAKLCKKLNRNTP
jgi:hypothetical protein